LKILVTGYKGFIAQNMLKHIPPENVVLFEWGEEFPSLDGVGTVMHFGAISSTTETDVKKIMHQNYDFSVWLLNECMYRGINMQYSSSASVYGMGTNFAEDAPPDPRNPYAWTKYLFDRHVFDRGDQFDITVQGFRYFNVHGPHEDHKGDQASPYHKFRKQKEETGKIKLFENSDKFLRDFVPVETVVRTQLAFLNVPESGIWNIGTGKPKSFLDVANEIGGEIEYIPMPEQLQRSYQAYTCADLTKLKNTINRYNINIFDQST